VALAERRRARDAARSRFVTTDVDASDTVLTTTSVDMTPSASTPPAGPPAVTCRAPSSGLDASLRAERLAELAKALAEPLRVSVVDVLRRHGEPLCQCELVPLFDVPQSTFSHHINKLVDAGLLTVERRHRWAYYSISSDALSELTEWLS
jgi:ArsR family transcriptional regulator